MATYYVFSGATGANNGTSWTDAYTSLGSAYTAAANAGDNILIHKDHNETLTADAEYQANNNHTLDNRLKLTVVDKDNSDTPVSSYTEMGAGGVSGVTNNSHIRMSGYQHCWGLRLICGDTTYSFNGDLILDHCEYGLDASANRILYVGSETRTILINSKLSFSGGGRNYVRLLQDAGRIEMYGGSITTQDDPDYVFEFTVEGSNVHLSGVDLSGAGATAAWSNFTVTSYNNGFVMENCYLPASPPPLASGDIREYSQAIAIACGGVDGRYYYDYRHIDNVASHTTSTYRTGGATYDGTNGYAINLVTGVVEDGFNGHRFLLAVVDGGSLLGKTIEIHFTHDVADAAGNLQDDEVWADFHTLDDVGGVHYETTRSLPTTAGTNLAADAGTSWTAEKTYKNKISHAWGGGATSGNLYVWLTVSKAFDGAVGGSITVCPKVEIV